MKQLSDYIITIDGAITDALCDAVLAEYKNCDDWHNASIKLGEDLNTRNCQVIGISYNEIIQKNLNTRKNLDSYLFASVSGAIKKYNKKFSLCAIEQDSGYDLLKYEVGQFYTQHTDSFKDRPRAVSCSFILNDDYEGGEFAFFDRELKYKLKKGSCIMFPSNFMYPHEIMPVTSGTRYSIVTWFI
jgi:predicted 2-oxoglutarate/Fe(II)-dependent dioxygenase YbiX